MTHNNFLKRIDLFNIAFSKDAPDRETGIKAYHEIKKCYYQ